MAEAGKSKTIVLGIAAAAVFIASLSVGPSTKPPSQQPPSPAPPSHPPGNVGIQLLGWTNAAAAQKAAILNLTNGGAVEVVMWPNAILTKDGELWTTNTTVPMPIQNALGGISTLKPGMNSTLIVPSPTNNASWKLQFTVVPKSDEMRGLKDKARDKRETVEKGTETQSYGGESYFIDSPDLSR